MAGLKSCAWQTKVGRDCFGSCLVHWTFHYFSQ